MRCSWLWMLLTVTLSGCVQMNDITDWRSMFQQVSVEKPKTNNGHGDGHNDGHNDGHGYDDNEVISSQRLAAESRHGQGHANPVTPAPMMGSLMSWPMRLVDTTPNAQPPRAILGMPDGTEHVITPGKMLPNYKVVVMSIGPNAAELAYILPSGDHAAVQTVSLQKQY
ncbi:MAG: hypothetical protein AAFV53_34610 [Myxococcota bacterium]